MFGGLEHIAREALMRIVLYDGLSHVNKSGDPELSPSGHFRLTIPGYALAAAGG